MPRGRGRDASLPSSVRYKQERACSGFLPNDIPISLSDRPSLPRVIMLSSFFCNGRSYVVILGLLEEEKLDRIMDKYSCYM